MGFLNFLLLCNCRLQWDVPATGTGPAVCSWAEGLGFFCMMNWLVLGAYFHPERRSNALAVLVALFSDHEFIKIVLPKII